MTHAHLKHYDITKHEDTADSFIYSDFCISVTKINVQRHEKQDQLWKISTIHKLNITAQMNTLHLKLLCCWKAKSFSSNIYQRNTKCLAENYKLCDCKRYRPTFNMTVLREKQQTCNSLDDSYGYNCNQTYCKDWKCGTQIIHGQLISRVIWYTY